MSACWFYELPWQWTDSRQEYFQVKNEWNGKEVEACELIERCSSKREMINKYRISEGRQWRTNYMIIYTIFTSLTVFILYVSWLT